MSEKIEWFSSRFPAPYWRYPSILIIHPPVDIQRSFIEKTKKKNIWWASLLCTSDIPMKKPKVSFFFVHDFFVSVHPVIYKNYLSNSSRLKPWPFGFEKSEVYVHCPVYVRTISGICPYYESTLVSTLDSKSLKSCSFWTAFLFYFFLLPPLLSPVSSPVFSLQSPVFSLLSPFQNFCQIHPNIVSYSSFVEKTYQ